MSRDAEYLKKHGWHVAYRDRTKIWIKPGWGKGPSEGADLVVYSEGVAIEIERAEQKRLKSTGETR